MKVQNPEGKVIDVGSASAVFAVDWDHDGDLDLLVGEIKGAVFLVVNEGSADSPRYAGPTKMHANGQVIRTPSGDSGPTAADWDGDGKLDLLVGTGAGGVLWYRNIGTPQEPKLADAQTLVAPSRSNPSVPSDRDQPWGVRLKICVVDYNRDGKLDLLAGDFNQRDIRMAAPVVEPTPEELAKIEKNRQKLAKLQAQYRKIAVARGRETPDQRRVRLEQVGQLQSQLAEVQRRIGAAAPRQGDYHGYVWLFLRVGEKTAEGRESSGKRRGS